MKLDCQPFDKIKSGAKTFELRLYDEKRKKIHIGDFIEFTKQNSNEKCIVKVKGLYLFDNFEALYKQLPLNECGYRADELSNASPKDMEKYYSKELQEQYGVIAIKIELI